MIARLYAGADVEGGALCNPALGKGRAFGSTALALRGGAFHADIAAGGDVQAFSGGNFSMINHILPALQQHTVAAHTAALVDDVVCGNQQVLRRQQSAVIAEGAIA